MMWIHIACTLMFIIRTFQSTMKYFGAYTRVFVTWSYAFLYWLGIMYTIFTLRMWAQIRFEIDHKIETPLTD